MGRVSQSYISVLVFLGLIACLPMAIKWAKQRAVGGVRELAGHSKIVSAVAVGPHQRVVTVEVGPEGARTLLVLGVTAQSISCLHSSPAAAHSSEPVVPPKIGTSE